MTQKTVLNFDDVCGVVQILHDKIVASEWQPQIIVPLVRGGATPGVMLSHLLDVPVQCLGWYTRDQSGLVQNESNCWLAEDAARGINILIVDDILDSGRTIQEIKKDWDLSVLSEIEWGNNVRIACLHQRYTSEVDADYAAITLDNDNWVVYPWENLNGRI